MENRRRESLLKKMTPSQKYYNSFANEWDIFGDAAPSKTFVAGDWKALIDSYIRDNLSTPAGEPVSVDSSSSSSSLSAPPPSRPLNLPPPPPTPLTRFVPRAPPSAPRAPPPAHRAPLPPPPSLTVDPSAVEITRVELPALDDICVILSERYGFVPPLGENPSIILMASTFTWDKVQRTLGSFSAEPPNKRLVNAILHFAEALSSGRRPHADVWDLDDQNRRWVTESNCNPFAMVAWKMDDKFIGLKHSVEGENCRWQLSLPGIESWLHSCRLRSYKPMHIAQYFLQRGIPFQTLVEVSNAPRQRPSSSNLRLIPRPRDDFFKEHEKDKSVTYRFTLQDYRQYEHRRAQLLSEPFGRAALMMGGIVWRLARDVIGDGDVLSGPSTTLTRDVFGSYMTLSDGSIWADNGLSHVELEIITGRYDCPRSE